MKASAKRWSELQKAQSAYVRSVDLTIANLERQQQRHEAERASILEKQPTMLRFGAAVVDMQSRHVDRMGVAIATVAAQLARVRATRQLQARRLKLIEILEERSRKRELVESEQEQLAEIIDAMQACASNSPGQG